MTRLIDTTLDLRLDSKGGDPDQDSPTLREYHRLLWSKSLPDGRPFTLTAPRMRGRYLHHESDLGEFFLASDTVVPTFRTYSYENIPTIVAELDPAELDAFQLLNHTIGGMMVFPGEKRPGVAQTLNGARGFNGRIRDRFDLTIECIRRHYLGTEDVNPLSATLTGYADFFDLFGSFEGYVDYFLLGDLVADDGSVRLFLPVDDFTRSALPQDVAEYREYAAHAMAFLRARNARIDRWVDENLARTSTP